MKRNYYDELKEMGLSDAEITDAYVFSKTLSKEEQDENDRKFSEYFEELKNFEAEKMKEALIKESEKHLKEDSEGIFID